MCIIHLSINMEYIQRTTPPHSQARSADATCNGLRIRITHEAKTMKYCLRGPKAGSCCRFRVSTWGGGGTTGWTADSGALTFLMLPASAVNPRGALSQWSCPAGGFFSPSHHLTAAPHLGGQPRIRQPAAPTVCTVRVARVFPYNRLETEFKLPRYSRGG